MSSFFKAICGGYDKNFSYIISCPISKELALVDASVSLYDLQSSLEEAQQQGYGKLSKIFLTHSHFDHIAFLQEIHEYSQTEIYAHPSARERVVNTTKLKITEINFLEKSTILSLGQTEVKAIHLPGHQTDCVGFIWFDKFFTGDTLFVEGCGRCDFPESSPEDQFESLKLIANELPLHLEVRAGHDYGSMPFSTIEREKKMNRYLIDLDEKYLNPNTKNIWLSLRMGIDI